MFSSLLRSSRIALKVLYYFSNRCVHDGDYTIIYVPLSLITDLHVRRLSIAACFACLWPHVFTMVADVCCISHGRGSCGA